MVYTGTASIKNERTLTEGSIVTLPIGELYSNKPQQPAPSGRKSGKIIRMVQSIQKYGLFSPVVVTPTEVFPGITRYLVQENEDVWQAACLAGLMQIPCLIAQNSTKEAEITDIFAQITSKSADMFEQAAAFRHLIDCFGLTQEEISRRTGTSQSTIANKLRLLHLTAAEQKKILLNGLSERHARALLRLKSPELRLTALETICRKNLSVASTEALVESFLPLKTSNLGQQGAVFTAKAAPPHIFAQSTDSTTSSCNKEALPLVAESKMPSKFVLHTLQPLYNSLERTLAIFRKTGRKATLESTETPQGLTITIEIPRV